jgi:hypothetical protein
MLARESLVLLDHSPAYRDHIPWCHIYLATALREQGRFAEAAKAAHAAYDTAVRGDEQYFIPFALYHRGHMAFLQEHFERATVLLEESCMFACGSIVAQGNAGRRPPPGAKCPGRQPLRQPVRILVAKTV